MAWYDIFKPNFSSGPESNAVEGGLASALNSLGGLASSAYQGVKNFFAPTAAGDIPASETGNIDGGYVTQQRINTAGQNVGYQVPATTQNVNQATIQKNLYNSSSSTIASASSPTQILTNSRPISPNINYGYTPPPSNYSYTPPNPPASNNLYNAPAPSPQAASGASGSVQGGSGYSQFSNGSYSPMAPTGAAGVSGAGRPPVSGFSSAGTTPTYPAAGQGAPEEQQKKNQKIPLSSPYQLPPGFRTDTTPNGGTLVRDNQGQAYLTGVDSNGGSFLYPAPQQLPGGNPTMSNGQEMYVSTNSAGPVQTQPFPPAPAFDASSPNGVLDMGTIQSNVQRISQIVTSGNFTKDDAARFQSELGKYAQYLTQNKLATSPVQGPSVPNDQFLVQGSPQAESDLAKLAAMRVEEKDAIFQKYGIPQITDDIKKMQAQIEAESEAYDQTIKDIKENPDLPAALGQRRIDLIQKAQNTNLTALKLKLGFLTDSYNMAVDQAKNDLGIYKDVRDEQEKQRDNARQMLSLALQSGATLSDTDVNSLANMMGVNPSLIRNVADVAAEKRKEFQQIGTGTNANGDVTVYGVRPDGTTQILSTLRGIAKGTTGGGSVAGIEGKIVSQINAAVDQYKMHPDGFRESYVSALVSQYGAQNADFIKQQVYALMPDTGTGKSVIPATNGSSLKGYLGSFGMNDATILKAAKTAGMKGSDSQLVDQWTNQIASSIRAWQAAGVSDQDILKKLGLLPK